MRKLAQILLGAYVFLFPFSVRSLLYSEGLYLDGGFDHYVSFFVYLNDLVLVLALIVFLVDSVVKGRELKAGGGIVLGFLGGLVFANLQAFVWAGDLEVAYFYVVRWFLFFVFVFLAGQGVLRRKLMVDIFIYSLVVQGVIGIFQYVFQGSLGLGFLGESLIGADVYGVAKFVVGKMVVVRAYGTFPHANVLGGALMVGIVLTFWRMRENLWLFVPMLVVEGIAFVLSFSRSAWLGLLVCAVVWLLFQGVERWKKIWKGVRLKYVLLGVSLLGFVLVAFNLQGVIGERLVGGGALGAVVERGELLEIGKKMIWDHPEGVGLGNFTLLAQDYSVGALMPWEIQPVHNVFVLFVAELGVLGGSLLLVFLGWVLVDLVRRRDYLCLSLVAGALAVMMFDHYFYTLFPGQFLLSFIAYLAIDSRG